MAIMPSCSCWCSSPFSCRSCSPSSHKDDVARADEAGRADVRRLRRVGDCAGLADVSVSALGRPMQTIEGDGRAAGYRFALVVSKYHDFVTDRLQAAALAALARSRCGAPRASRSCGCPGAFEIPLAAQHARGKRALRRHHLSRLPDSGRDAAHRVHRVGRGRRPAPPQPARPACRCRSACSPRIRWRRRWLAPARGRRTKDTKRPWPPSRWRSVAAQLTRPPSAPPS